MLTITRLHPAANINHLGFIPSFLSLDDPRPAREQFDANYIGGWNPFTGFTLNQGDKSIEYPGDPRLPALFEMTFREEAIFVYSHAWVLILQKDGSFEISRMD